MQKLADTCIRLSEKLKEAEVADTENTAKIAQLESSYLADLEKKSADYRLLQSEKEEQIK